MVEVLQSFRLDGKVAVVTGASAGLGARFAEVLHAAGARVVLGARRGDVIERLIDERGLENAVAVECDVTREADRNSIIELALSQYGQVDVLINNAGSANVAPATEETVADFTQVVDINLIAPFALSQLVARRAIEDDASVSIVNVASMYALVGSGQIPEASYHASKGGLVALTKELAAQWARKSIRVNALAPGYFPTDMTSPLLDDEKGLAWVRKKTPVGRPGRIHELDGALLFLSSEASSYVTGHTLSVDGGWTAI